MASMEFHLLPIFVLFSQIVLAAVAVEKIALVTTRAERSDVSVPAEIYWHSKLPNTPIPQDLFDLIHHVGDKHMFRPFYGRLYEQPFAEDTTDSRFFYAYEQPFAEDTTDSRFFYSYEQAFVEDTNDRREKYGKRYGIKFSRHALSNSTVFFLPNDLHTGKKMRIHITKSANKARILPRQVADSLPFSTNKLPEIMKHFSVNSESRRGKMLKQTVENCESPEIKGEDKFCATSLESLVDFSVKHVGNKAQVLMNEIDKPKREQEYTIKEVKFIGENHVVCHKQHYPYAVYYCHALKGTKVYTAQVVGADGTKAKAVAVCHTDTSDWNPGHLAFLVLNMKPGEGTVCHFIRSDTFVMVSN